MSAHYTDNSANGCEWNIEEVEIPYPDTEVDNN